MYRCYSSSIYNSIYKSLYISIYIYQHLYQYGDYQRGPGHHGGPLAAPHSGHQQAEQRLVLGLGWGWAGAGLSKGETSR